MEVYLEQLVEEPEIASAISVLMTAVPTSVQQAYESNPAGFIENIAARVTLPAWVTDNPAPLQSGIGSTVNEALSIIGKDLKGEAITTGVSRSVVPSPGQSNRCSRHILLKGWQQRQPF